MKKIILLFLVVSIQSIQLNAQKSEQKAWVNNISLAAGVNSNYTGYNLFTGLTGQVSYLRYKLINPRFGLGGGVGTKNHGGIEFAFDSYSSVRFIDLFVYNKFFLIKKKRTLYLDAKLGYGFTDFSIEYCPYECSVPNDYAFAKYTSGYMIQPGLGFEFAKKDVLRVGLKVSGYLQKATVSKQREKVLSGIMFGFDFYF